MITLKNICISLHLLNSSRILSFRLENLLNIQHGMDYSLMRFLTNCLFYFLFSQVQFGNPSRNKWFRESLLHLYHHIFKLQLQTFLYGWNVVELANSV